MSQKKLFLLEIELTRTTFLSISEKTPKCLINELARHNKISLEYVRVDESGKTRDAMVFHFDSTLSNFCTKKFTHKLEIQTTSRRNYYLFLRVGSSSLPEKLYKPFKNKDNFIV